MPPPNRNVKDLFDLTDRVAIVTGGGTHLGTAFAEALGEAGAAVYIASRRGKLCEEVAAKLRDERGINVTGAQCDATDEAQVRGLVERVVSDRGRLDVMVCNAGGHRTTTYPPHGKLDEFRAAFEINLVSTYVCAQEAAKAMIPRRHGRIITLGSIASNLTTDPRIYNETFQRSGPPYIAAKGGVWLLTRALAGEFGRHGITVNCISPGQIPKDETNAEQVEKFRQMNALDVTGLAEDLKGACLLLASDAGKWITGQQIIVDGGWSIW